jgi:hypothetical protein
MVDWITDEEMDRIQEFASKPRYQREPQQLVPEEEGDVGADEVSAD